MAGNRANLDKDEYTPYLLYLWLEPRRCPFNLTSGNLTNTEEAETSLFCNILLNLDFDLLTEDEETIINSVCVVWGNGQQNSTNEELSSKAAIRSGAIQQVSLSTLGNLTLADGVTVEETIYSVDARYNQTTTIRTA